MVCTATLARAEEEPGLAADKSHYSLFNPTPTGQMREFQTDRPDQTEGPYTVDAGHLQVEMDLVTYFYDRRNPEHVTREALVVADPTFRLGLLNDVEAQLITTSFVYQETRFRDTGASDYRSGSGDTILRAKWNLWGNDGGDTAFALLPYLKLPTNTRRLGNRYVEGGLILPLTVKLPLDFELDLMTEFDVLRNGDDRGYHLESANSLALHRDLIKDRLNAYIEFYSAVSRDPHAGPVETVDTGLLLLVAENVQLDCGVNIGLTRRAINYNPFVGLTVRF